MTNYVQKVAELRKTFHSKELKDCLMLLWDGAQKRAKADKNREMNDTDITASAYALKKLLKEEESFAIKKDNYSKSFYELQYSILNEFLLEEFSDEEVESLIKSTFDSLKLEKNKKSMGTLIKHLKEATIFRYDEKKISQKVMEFFE